MKQSCLLALVIITFGLAIASGAEIWQRVTVPASHSEINRILCAGADLEGNDIQGGRLYFYAEAGQVRKWQAMGIDARVADADVIATYRKIASEAVPASSGFANGSMGGFFTLDEALQRLEQYRKINPAIMSAKMSIGTSIEGRPLWAYKISDNVKKTENEPRSLFTGLTHAREPQGMMCVLYFIKYIMDHYGNDPEVTWLVNNRELWFVPISNPDGYVYNQTTDPLGGGMWRKNRRLNADLSTGVDLNRNYDYQWGYDNIGSSPDEWDETYRGTEPFSEPETAAIKVFSEKMHFKTAFEFHSYGNWLVYPWGYIDEIPEKILMNRLSAKLVAQNGFVPGNSFTTVNYPTNGVSDDWFYGVGHAYCMTAEVGSYIEGGFWPTQSRIEPLAQLTLSMNLTFAGMAGSYVTVESSTLTDASGDGILNTNENGTLRLKISNLGVGGTSPALSVRVYSNDSRVIIVSGGAFTLTALSPKGKGTNFKVINLKGGANSSCGMVTLYVEYSQAEKVIRKDSVKVRVCR